MFEWIVRGKHRIYGPTNLLDGFHIAKVKGWTDPLLLKIEKIYDGLKIEKEVLDHGFCFGLLDPTANIVFNGFLAPAKGDKQAGDMIQRSFKGLVAFLTYLFPYLPEAEAVEYLEIAGADAFIAAHLVVIRRGLLDSCLYNNPAAVETALTCAAVAARHPAPEKLLLAWKHQSSDLFRLSSASPDYSLSLDLMKRLTVVTGKSAPTLDVKTSWVLAGYRLVDLCPLRRQMPPARGALKRILHATIHGFYLEALGCLPKDNQCTTYHRSMLFGGYCYGPLDPVSNIIINTIWFELNFPAGKHVALEMISTECLWRVAARSLYGLVSFMCTRYERLTPDVAMHRLLMAGADLRVADPHFFVAGIESVDLPVADPHFSGTRDTTRSHKEMEATGSPKRIAWSHGLTIGSSELSTFLEQAHHLVQISPSITVEDAYIAAANAAFHLDPLAQVELLVSKCVPSQLFKYSGLLPIRVDRMLSHEDLKVLTCAFLYPPYVDKMDEPMPMELKRAGFSDAYTCEDKFLRRLHRVSKMVEDALHAFNDKYSKGTPFRLHVICGVNELVSGPEISKDPDVREYNPWTSYKYHNSHINFLAVQEGQPDGPATLFFAEGSNHGADDCWCLPLKTPDPLAEQVRCIYCEKQGIRIVHPVKQPFRGRDMEFVKVLREEPLFYGLSKVWFTNDRIVKRSRNGDWVHGVEDDAVYANYCAAAPPNDDDYGVDSAGGGGDRKKLRRPCIIS